MSPTTKHAIDQAIECLMEGQAKKDEAFWRSGGSLSPVQPGKELVPLDPTWGSEFVAAQHEIDHWNAELTRLYNVARTEMGLNHHC